MLEPGYYHVDLTYAGSGRIGWAVEVEGGDRIQNQQNSSHNYQRFPIGWIQVSKPGHHKINVSSIDGDKQSASLKAIHLHKVKF